MNLFSGKRSFTMAELQWTVTAGQPPYAVWMRVTQTHESVLAELYGGTRPHLGAWAAVGPEAQVHSGAFGNHKELPLAQDAAQMLLQASGCNVVVVAGIHVDNATHGDIDLLCANAADVIHRAASRLADGS